jgi:hypothetical protein
MVVSQAILYCREQGIPKLFVDATRLAGFPHQLYTTIDRHWLAHEWAEKGRGTVVVAILAKPEYVDPEKFGSMVAQNFGLQLDTFTSEAEAWKFLGKHNPAISSG